MAIDLSDEIVADFLVEAGEILERLGEQLVDLETRPQDTELLNAVFRGFHTIKGGAGFLGVDAMVGVCHRAEDTFNLLRNGERLVDPDLMDVMLQVLDTLNGMFASMRAGDDPEAADAELMRRLEMLARNEQPAPPVTSVPQTTAGTPAEAPPGAGAPVRAKPACEPAPVARKRRTRAGKTGARSKGGGRRKKELPAPVPEAPPAAANGEEISDEEFEALLDSLQRPAPAPTPAPAPAEATSVPQSDEEHMEDAEFVALLDTLHGKAKAPAPVAPDAAEAAEAATKPSAPGARAAPAGKLPAEKKSQPEPPRGEAAETTVRVDTGVLDRIMNMVGELVLVRNRIATLESALTDEQLAKAVGNLDVVTADLQAAVMRTRMQPIRKVFGRFPRVVRDLARHLGKEVDLALQGEDTDLDKNLVEALADPMVHLVRNAVDHGLEAPQVREAAGKPRRGTVTLSAEQEGDHILLTVADDGAGMDPDVLRRKAVDKGLMDADAAARLDDRACYHLIFAPGFSTKSEISDVSGRGVGMDVVKNRIAALNGSVDIDSRLGKGTRVLITVPLTLAIVPTLMVVLGEQIFALPLVNVREIFDLEPQRTNVVDGQLVVVVRGKPLPLFFLGDWLARGGRRDALGAAQPSGGHVVIVHVGTQPMGFVVDQLIGQEEVVIKPLGTLLHGIQGLAGATITGDGRIALILDAAGLVSAYAHRR